MMCRYAKTNLFNFWIKYVKEIKCPINWEEYGMPNLLTGL